MYKLFECDLALKCTMFHVEDYEEMLKSKYEAMMANPNHRESWEIVEDEIEFGSPILEYKEEQNFGEPEFLEDAF